MFTRSQLRLLIKISQQCRFYGVTAICSKGARFSESSAYHGMDKAKTSRAADLNVPLYIPNKYDSYQFQLKRTVYAILSVTALIVYFAFLR